VFAEFGQGIHQVRDEDVWRGDFPFGQAADSASLDGVLSEVVAVYALAIDGEEKVTLG